MSLALEVALHLIKRFEGCRLSPYLCPAGVPTIGYGSTRYLDGRVVQLSDPKITLDDAQTLLLCSVEQIYLPGVLKLCPNIDTPNRLAALIDFTYNLGVGRLKSSTLRREILAERWENVPTELSKWVLAGGRRLPGLVRRRQVEAALV
jgi:lysozyme